MFKKAISILLAWSLLLTLAAACQNSPGPAPEETTEPAFTALELAEAISDAAPDAPDGPESFDSRELEVLHVYIEAAYGLPADEWEDGAVVAATGARAYEIAVLRFADEAGAEHGLERLEGYMTARASAFSGYAPEQAAIVSGAAACREGLYVGMFICEDSPAAQELFISILKTGVLPQRTEEPEPSPVSDLKMPVEMQRLMVGIMESWWSTRACASATPPPLSF